MGCAFNRSSASTCSRRCDAGPSSFMREALNSPTVTVLPSPEIEGSMVKSGSYRLSLTSAAPT